MPLSFLPNLQLRAFLLSAALSATIYVASSEAFTADRIKLTLSSVVNVAADAVEFVSILFGISYPLLAMLYETLTRRFILVQYEGPKPDLDEILGSSTAVNPDPLILLSKLRPTSWLSRYTSIYLACLAFVSQLISKKFSGSVVVALLTQTAKASAIVVAIPAVIFVFLLVLYQSCKSFIDASYGTALQWRAKMLGHVLTILAVYLIFIIFGVSCIQPESHSALHSSLESQLRFTAPILYWAGYLAFAANAYGRSIGPISEDIILRSTRHPVIRILFDSSLCQLGPIYDISTITNLQYVSHIAVVLSTIACSRLDVNSIGASLRSASKEIWIPLFVAFLIDWIIVPLSRSATIGLIEMATEQDSSRRIGAGSEDNGKEEASKGGAEKIDSSTRMSKQSEAARPSAEDVLAASVSSVLLSTYPGLC